MITKNEIITLEITDITTEGSGVGRHEGMAIFVPLTAIGDIIEAQIVKVQKNYCFGIIKEILTPSPQRIPSDCPVFQQCGGCDFRHMTYEAERDLKRNRVEQGMKRIGKVDLQSPPTMVTPKDNHYRNKAIFPIQKQDGKVVMGFYAKRSHRIVEQYDCKLHPVFFAEIAHTVRDFLQKNNISIYDEVTHKGLVRSLYIRHGGATGEVMVCLVLNGDVLPHKDKLIALLQELDLNIVSIMLNVNRGNNNVLLGKLSLPIFGKRVICDRLCGLEFDISPLSFYQVNRDGAELLYGVAKGFAALTGSEVLLDLYCGAGTIGLSMAKDAGQVIGVEIISDAVVNARDNALRNGITNARFICGDAAEAATQLKAEGIVPDVVVIDPPRKGCEPSLIDTIAQMAPSRIVMVSCDPATAARDVALFAKVGYHADKLQVVDMFPRTGHVETVVSLIKQKPIDHIKVELDLDELDLTKSEMSPTYPKIKDFVEEKYGFKVSSLYIAQVKDKFGLDKRLNYNVSKKDDVTVPVCPPEKEEAIVSAFKHFGLI